MLVEVRPVLQLVQARVRHLLRPAVMNAHVHADAAQEPAADAQDVTQDTGMGRRQNPTSKSGRLDETNAHLSLRVQVVHKSLSNIWKL